ncbi:hypothetical protein V1514DRAFT_329262 [Lipomyces japonicus]|uniref:uncharacterized protein n=1 Tax=Lipomyces japonicus TaxID=56871 RepID=UPI0034CFB462
MAARSKQHRFSKSHALPPGTTGPDQRPGAEAGAEVVTPPTRALPDHCHVVSRLHHDQLHRSTITPAEQSSAAIASFAYDHNFSQNLSCSSMPAPSQLVATSQVHRTSGPAAALDVIRRQFDLEILLKHRELLSIEDEIAKVHVMMVQLRRCAGKVATDSDVPDDFSKHYAKYLLPDRRYSDTSRPDHTDNVQLATPLPQGQSQSLSTPSSSSSAATVSGRPKISSVGSRMHQTLYAATGTTVSGNPPPQGCIYRRPDGILVRLVCAKCDRHTFGSAQGFINHCRISHSLEFTSHDHAAQNCGVELDEADQDDIGLGAIRHRRHMQMSALPIMAPSVRARSASTSSLSSSSSPSSSSSSSSPATHNPDNNTSTTKLDYGTKSFPWNYTSNSSSHSFIAQPITPPNEPQSEQISKPSAESKLTEQTPKSQSQSTQSLTTTQSQSQPQPRLQTPAQLEQVQVQYHATPYAAPIPAPLSFPARPLPPPPSTDHLRKLLKRKQVEIDVDKMVADSVKRDPRGHLFAGESDVSDDEDELNSRLPSVAKYKRMAAAAAAAGHGRGRPVGSGMRIIAGIAD